MAVKKKLQSESEQAAKVYQTDAIEAKIDSLSDTFKIFSVDMNRRVDTLITKSDGLVTENRLNERLTDAIREVHLRYAPLKSRTNTITGTLITAVVLQLIYITFNLFGGK